MLNIIIPWRIIMTKEEKQRRKQLIAKVNKNSNEEFEKKLPMKKETFIKLFNYLDQKLSENGCDETYKFTKEYLNKIEYKDLEGVFKWLSENGGYCDCEILANCEELFQLKNFS